MSSDEPTRMSGPSSPSSGGDAGSSPSFGKSYGQSSGPGFGDSPGHTAPYGQPSYGPPPSQPGGQSAPYGQTSPYGQPGQGGNPYGIPAGGYQPTNPNAPQRPGTVLTAAIITFVATGISIAFALLLIFLGAIGASFFYGLEDDTGLGNAFGTVIVVLVVIGLLYIGICVAAIFCAAKMLKGSNGARITLVVFSCLLAAVCVISIIGTLSDSSSEAGGAIGSIVYLLVAISTVVLVFTGGANEWFASRGPNSNIQVTPGYNQGGQGGYGGYNQGGQGGYGQGPYGR